MYNQNSIIRIMDSHTLLIGKSATFLAGKLCIMNYQVIGMEINSCYFTLVIMCNGDQRRDVLVKTLEDR